MPTTQYVEDQRDMARKELYSAEPEPKPNPHLNAAFRLYKPEFVDVRNEKVYLPFILPREVKAYIEQTTKTYDTDGITFMLAHEPDHLFDMIEKQAHWQTALTDWAFLGLDVSIIFFFAVGVAGSFELPSTIGDFLSKL